MPKVTVKRWHGVAAWRWDVSEESCGICRQPFDEHCDKCKLPGDDCAPAWGECNHIFHLHCIVKWIQSRPQENPTCCMCRRPWNFKESDA